MFETRCHCGNVHIKTTLFPDVVTSCNCSICRRYGALWAYYDESQMTVRDENNSLSTYKWGKEKITFHVCGNCSCVMYHSCLDRDGVPRVGINSRMADPELPQEIAMRFFDGADTWEYMRDSGT